MRNGWLRSKRSMPSAAPSYWLPKVRVHSAGRNRAEERDLPARQGFGRRNPRRQMDPSEVDTRHQHDLASAGGNGESQGHRGLSDRLAAFGSARPRRSLPLLLRKPKSASRPTSATRPAQTTWLTGAVRTATSSASTRRTPVPVRGFRCFPTPPAWPSLEASTRLPGGSCWTSTPW